MPTTEPDDSKPISVLFEPGDDGLDQGVRHPTMMPDALPIGRAQSQRRRRNIASIPPATARLTTQNAG